jgi:hypothetical protein
MWNPQKVIIIMDLVTASPLSYDGYEYPTWAQNFGYIFTFIPITLVPILAIIEYFKYPGGWKTVRHLSLNITSSTHVHLLKPQKLAYSITPTNEHHLIKEGGVPKRLKQSHWFRRR